jgi:glutamate--cysteine ligase
VIPRLYVEQPLASGAMVAADERALHYLRNVMRRAPGDAVVLFNGRDGEFEAKIAALDKRKAELTITRQRRAQDSVPDIVLCFAPLKKDAIGFLVEKATELGIAAFQPVITRRTVASRLNLERLCANAIEAAEQSERLTVPEVRAPLTFDALLEGWQPARHMILCAEAGPTLPIADALKALTFDVSPPNTWAIFCGPEGGFHVSDLGRRHAASAASDDADRHWGRGRGIGASMSAPPKAGGAPITSKRQLVEYFEQGCKPRSEWRVGTEHEKFVFDLETLRTVSYEQPNGIGALLRGLQRFGWQPVEEHGNVIALTMEGCSITLEPGGQFELSGAPLRSIHETCAEVGRHLQQVKEVGSELKIGLLGMGMNPKWPRADTPWMPKGRYKIMRKQMERKGKLGIDMMTRTCTVQANLDFASEADMVKKLRVSLALQPIATALFADSPFTDGKPNGFMSFRSHVWTDTDPDRCGTLPFAFEDGMGFERYVDYMLDVPMYFVYRDGEYIDAAGQSFRDFMRGQLPALPGEIPSMGDWSDHVTTAFPEVRLKRYIEMRGADGGPWDRLCALPALWVGLLYDDQALDAAWDLVKDWTPEEHDMLRREVPKQALRVPLRDRKLQHWALETIAIARAGLHRRAALDKIGGDESGFLNVLQEIAESGRCPAEEKLELYNGRWNRSVDPVFTEFAY